MTKVCIAPSSEAIAENNGIGRVVHAQYKYLPKLGVGLVGKDQADVIACHTQKLDMPRVDVLHCHGLYWTREIGTGQYNRWHSEANRRIASAAREAKVITVPSEWVAMPFKRDMRVSPTVIGHGIELSQWQVGVPQGYALWNKNRFGDVCTPEAALQLAESGIRVVSTFGRYSGQNPKGFQVTGVLPQDQMKQWISGASVYLATTQETFGIGTLEAMACGVPVLGWDYGGTADLVTHKTNGYLVPYGNYEALIEGYHWLNDHRKEMSQNARVLAEQYDWLSVMRQYAALYSDLPKGNGKVSVVVTCYNYASYLKNCLDSVARQSLPVELIVVDDGSTDATPEILSEYGSAITVIRQENQGVAAARNHGIAAANGEYIICLDADDSLHPEYAATLQRAMQANLALGIAYTGLTLQRNDSFSLSDFPPDFSWERQAAVGNPPSNCIPSAAMFRRSLWERSGGYRQVYAPGEDAEFWTRGLSLGFEAKKIVPDGLFVYRVHADSQSKLKQYKPIDMWHPWMRDQQYPLAAPAKDYVAVSSYSRPVVSVIIPVSEKHLETLSRAIETVIGQTFREWELIVVGDKCVPNLDQYPFITFILNDSSEGGPGKCRNLGIAVAKAPLVLFLDADDMLAPTALQRMVSEYAKTGKYVYTNWKPLDGEAQKSGPYSLEGILRGPLHGVTALVPTIWAKSLKFNEQLEFLEDWEFYARLANEGGTGTHLAEVLHYVDTKHSTRTPAMLAKRDVWVSIVRDTIAQGIGGDMSKSCCGGDGGAILAAKQAIGLVPMDSIQQDTPVSEGVVRMEYIGLKQGAVTYGGNGTTKNPSGYRAGANSFDRYVNALPEDVAYLVGLGVFRVIKAAPVIEAPKPAPVSAPVEILLPTWPDSDVPGDINPAFDFAPPPLIDPAMMKVVEIDEKALAEQVILQDAITAQGKNDSVVSSTSKPSKKRR